MPSARVNPEKITEFDEAIKQAHIRFKLPLDWRMTKAQLVAESGLNPIARSPVDAVGLAQFMPETWREVMDQLNMPLNTSRTDPEASIIACAHYMSSLIKKWKSPRPEIDRYCFALASYNAGMGNILKAQKRATEKRAFASVIAELPHITGPDNAKQTHDYVKRILSVYHNLVASH